MHDDDASRAADAPGHERGSQKPASAGASAGGPEQHVAAGGRLDKVLQLRGLASSRTRAAQLIAEGVVRVDGRVARKASASIGAHQDVTVLRSEPWVSRAAHKLIGALGACPEIAVSGARCLDAGASTGGFTQVLLSRGAGHVVAADVGRDQMAPEVGEDPRVTVVEGLNLRYVEPGELGPAFDVVVGDLSFISLRMLLEPLRQQAAPGADMLLMVKPQFEVGRERLPKSGVVTNAQLRRDAVAGVVGEAVRLGLAVEGVHRSVVLGQDGNAEFFVHFTTPRVDDTAEKTSPSNLAPAANAKLDEIDYS